MPYGYVYRADYDEECGDQPEGWDSDDRWSPSIYMPKEACRIFLRVTDIRVERVQDISSADCEAEGAKEYGYSAETGELMPTTPVLFQILWDNINAKRDGGAFAWGKNPWVWVISFERTEKPEGWSG